jgi:choline-sulfatase
MMIAGPGIPAGSVCDTPVTLADGFPTFIHALGAKPHPDDAKLPGNSLIDIAQGLVPARTILSEYHAAGSMCGAFMIRHGQWKYIHYATVPPMLFDLKNDPLELRDLGRDPAFKTVIAECEQVLRKVVDPDAAHRLAMADQKARIEQHGGVEAIKQLGTFRYSPPPGAKASYY